MIAFTPFGWDIPLSIVVLGMIVGLTYGLLAVGLVLVYRTNRIINFAHGEVGAFGATVFGMAVTKWHVPYYVALPLALLLGGAVAAGAEVAVVRRLRNAPRLMSVVATLGVGQFLVVISFLVNTDASAGFLFPSPPGLPEFQLGALRVTRAYTGMLVFAPLLVLGLVLFLRKSWFGIGIRSAAANPDAARLAGIFAGRMSSLAWGLAGGVSTFTALMILPSRSYSTGEVFGPSLLLRALVGAVVARMQSLPVAMAAGVGLGVVEQLLLWNNPRGGLVEVVLFSIVLVTLLTQRRSGGREDEKGSWAAVQAWRPLPEAYTRVWTIRHLGKLIGAAALVVALVLPLVMSHTNAVVFVGMMSFAIVGLSVGVVTGLGGQLTLGQFAVAAIGATVSYHVSSRTNWFPVSFLYAGLAGSAVSLLLGLPALRLRGLMLTVTTLGFALVTPAWLLSQPWMLGDAREPGRPRVFGNELDTGKEYFYFALLVLLVMLWLAGNVRRSGFARLLIAVRDNEDNARAFTVRARTVKLQGFLLAGFMAGVGGALYGHTLSNVSASAFPVRASIDAVVMTVLGGMSILAGPLIGVFYVIGVPQFLPLDSAGLAATNLGALVLILYAPGGLAQLLQPVRDRVVGRLARRAGVTEALDEGAPDSGVRPARQLAVRMVEPLGQGHRPRLAQGVLFEGIDLRKRFGGVTAVDGVSLHVCAGETVGLIGPNGAGKTTTFELLGGFTRPDAGRVVFDRTDVSRFGPEERARMGLIRSFQDAALFPTMTVLETVLLAMEKTRPTSFLGSVVGYRSGHAAKERRAREIVASMGLDAYRNKQIQELSTGTRRITEIACLVALEPTLLLLDEPSSGIAQRETEALGALLRDLKEQFDLSMLVIEHDIPLIMGLSDRVVAMDAGRVIADGAPEYVRVQPQVVEAYLGGSIQAVNRSGPDSRTNGSGRSIAHSGAPSSSGTG